MVDNLQTVNDYTRGMTQAASHLPVLHNVSFRFSRKLDGETADQLSDALDEISGVVSVLLHNNEATDGDDWTVSLTTRDAPNCGEILRRIRKIDPGLIRDEKDISHAPVPDTDWLRHVHDNFPPVTIGGFFVYGSHYEGAVPGNLTGLHIDAATAFGSGEHETTKGCILALEKLKGQGLAVSSGLDMGCGSGILAIAMVKLWPQAVVYAVDIDPESIVVTNRHASLNDVAGQVHTQTGDGYKAPLAKKGAPYDAICANILAGPLIDMAQDAASCLKPGGYAILSGLLRRQKEDVVAAHEKAGFRLAFAEEMGDWQALVLQKGAL